MEETDPMRTTIWKHWKSLNKHNMRVQTGGGSDVVVNFNPNMFNHELW